jgi:hypothetical protein
MKKQASDFRSLFQFLMKPVDEEVHILVHLFTINQLIITL